MEENKNKPDVVVFFGILGVIFIFLTFLFSVLALLNRDFVVANYTPFLVFISEAVGVGLICLALYIKKLENEVFGESKKDDVRDKEEKKPAKWEAIGLDEDVY